MVEIREELEKLRNLIHSGLVYGSLVRDIDILLVVDNEQVMEEVREELNRLSRRLERPLDVSLKCLEEVENRISHHDFNFGSALTTTRFYLANRPYLERAKDFIFGTEPGRESVLFNFSEGLYAFDVSVFDFQCFEFYQRSDWYRNGVEVKDYFRVVLENSLPQTRIGGISGRARHYLGNSVTNLSFSLGYLIATRIMQEGGEVIDLNFLLSNQLRSPEHKLFMENRRNIERYRNALELDPSEIRSQIEETKGYYEKYTDELLLLEN